MVVNPNYMSFNGLFRTCVANIWIWGKSLLSIAHFPAGMSMKKTDVNRSFFCKTFLNIQKQSCRKFFFIGSKKAFCKQNLSQHLSYVSKKNVRKHIVSFKCTYRKNALLLLFLFGQKNFLLLKLKMQSVGVIFHFLLFFKKDAAAIFPFCLFLSCF